MLVCLIAFDGCVNARENVNARAMRVCVCVAVADNDGVCICGGIPSSVAALLLAASVYNIYF